MNMENRTEGVTDWSAKL